MRHRERKISYVPYITMTNPLNGYQEQLNSKAITVGSPLYNTANESISLMDDALTPRGSSRLFNPCVHTRSSAAVFGSDYVEYTYTPSTPTCRISVNQPIGYQPGYVTQNIDWGGALDDLASQVSGNINDSWMVAVTLKEMTETIAMVRNPFKLLKPHWRRRTEKSSASSLASQRAAGVWLEYTYGWKSMYYDIESAAKALAYAFTPDVRSKLEELAERFSVSGKIQGTDPSTIYLNGDEGLWSQLASGLMPSIQTYGGMIRLSRVTTTTEWRVGCRRLPSLINHYSRTAKLLSAASLSNWRSIRDTLWEVIPFSFVIDWFVDSRGIWRSLNEERLSRAEISDVGWSIKQRTEYDAAYSLGFPLLPYFNSWRWLYKPPTACTKPIAKATSPGSYVYYARTAGFPHDEDVDSIFLNRGLRRLQCLSGLALFVQSALNQFPPRRRA